MKGDFSRLRFNRSRHYTSVLTQQGRVELDSDANEQRAIDEHLRTIETLDIVGQSGAPVGAAGFEITLSASQALSISAGRYYVDGLLCENPAPLDYNSQPYLLHAQPTLASSLAALKSGAATAVQVYLKVWQRLVTPIDDPAIQEVALGEADTTDRLQTVWRVIAEQVLAPPATPTPTPTPARGITAAAFSNLADTNVIRSTVPATLSRLQTATAVAATGLVAPAPAAALSAAALEAKPTVLAAAVGAAGTQAAAEAEAGSQVAAIQEAGSQVAVVQPAPPPTPSCCDQMAVPPESVPPGTMDARTGSPDTNASPCLPAPSAGYRGLENQLYRVEIHLGGSASEATFKWSRDNGSVVTAINSTGATSVNVDSLGPDANLGFQPTQWVELTDDSDEFGPTPNQPGTLAQIQSVDATQRQIGLSAAPPALDVMQGHAKLRRWDQSGPSATSNGIPLAAGTWIELENGIQVSFSATGQYLPGDYWLIPARTATGKIDWPPPDSDNPGLQPPHRTKVHRAALACIHFLKGNYTVEPCWRTFYPLIDLTPAAAPPALHVTNIGWANDSLFTVNQLSKLGLQVTFDTEPASPVTSATFIVEANVPIMLMRKLDYQSPLVGTVLSVTPVFDISPVNIDHTKGTTLFTWMLSAIALRVLGDELLSLAQVGYFLRLRVTLKGRFIFAPSGTQTAYLDGRALGRAATAADGTTPRIDLILPSGDGDRSSDFESWFTLVPSLDIQSLAIAPPAIAPAATDVPPVGVARPGLAPLATERAAVPAADLAAAAKAGAQGVKIPAQPVAPGAAASNVAPAAVNAINTAVFRNIDPVELATLQVTTTTWQVTLNYPPPVNIPVTLTVTGGGGLISVPASVTVSAGTTSQTFVVSSINMADLPAAQPQIVATLTDTAGDTATMAAAFKTS
ncbi:hypothetical protein IQ288_31545 [Burkholderia sp. R-69980]|nr:hypothetical protein [Burkholderia sp. R-69980]